MSEDQLRYIFEYNSKFYSIPDRCDLPVVIAVLILAMAYQQQLGIRARARTPAQCDSVTV